MPLRYRETEEQRQQRFSERDLERSLQEEKIKGGIGSIWESLNPAQKVGMSPFGFPFTDAIGLAGDMQMYRDEPETRSGWNYALSGLGLLPFAPSVASTILKKGKGAKNPVIDAKKKFEKKAREDYEKAGSKWADELETGGRNASQILEETRKERLSKYSKLQLNFRDTLIRNIKNAMKKYDDAVSRSGSTLFNMEEGLDTIFDKKSGDLLMVNKETGKVWGGWEDMSRLKNIVIDNVDPSRIVTRPDGTQYYQIGKGKLKGWKEGTDFSDDIFKVELEDGHLKNWTDQAQENWNTAENRLYEEFGEEIVTMDPMSFDMGYLDAYTPTEMDDYYKRIKGIEVSPPPKNPSLKKNTGGPVTQPFYNDKKYII